MMSRANSTAWAGSFGVDAGYRNALSGDPSFARRSSLASGLTLRSHKSKPKIEITLDDQLSQTFVPSYTTLDQIRGTATVTSPTDMMLDDIHISFQGTVRTYVEKQASAAPVNPQTRAFHTFLRLMQPIAPSEIPEHGVLRAGRSYEFSFVFVVPESLLPQSCSHQKGNSSVEEQHLKLPPSLGDPMVSGDGKSLLPDLAPDMSVVSYVIRVTLMKKPAHNAQNANSEPKKTILLADTVKKLRVIPAYEEAPPLRIDGNQDDDYVTAKTKSVKKGLFQGKMGWVTAEVLQPRSLHLPYKRELAQEASVESPPGTNGENDSPMLGTTPKPSHPSQTSQSNDHPSTITVPVTTMATINLRFYPAKPDSKPPKVSQLGSRLKVATFFSTVPLRHIPFKSSTFSSDLNHGLFVETTQLAARNLTGGVTWSGPHKIEERQGSAVNGSTVSAAANASSGACPTNQNSRSSSDEDEGPLRANSETGPPGPATRISSRYQTNPMPKTAKPNSHKKSEEQKQREAAMSSGVYWTAKILCPISLPTTCHTFVPTFHSCLLSRIYAIDLSLSLSGTSSSSSNPVGGFGGGGTSIHLKVPVQVSAEGNKDARPIISAEEQIAIDRRNTSVGLEPRPFGVGNSAEAPPAFSHIGYTGFDAEGQDMEEGDLGRRPRIQLAEEASAAEADDEGRVSPGGGAARIGEAHGLNGAEAGHAEQQEAAFGSVTWDPVSVGSDGPGSGPAGDQGGWRRASEGGLVGPAAQADPPGYESAAGGGLLAGSGGLVRALS